MNDEIVKLYFSENSLCYEGIDYLCDRGLSISESKKRGICSKDGMIYFMYILNGKVVRWKARSMKDKKKQFMSKLDSKDESLFKMPFFSHSNVATFDYLIITEGEFDCVALSQLGASNCVSLPNGAGSVESSFRNNYEFLQQFDLIYIAFDMDAAGEEAAKKAMAMIPPKKFRRICFPCKDANEWLKEYDPEFKDLQLLMNNSQKIHMPYLTHLQDLPENFYEEVDLGVSSGWEKLDGVIGGIRLGELTVVTADTGAGKSTFTLNMLINIALQGNRIWINSYEMDPKMVNRKIASIILNKKMKFKQFQIEDLNKYKEWIFDKNVFLNLTNNCINIETLRSQFEMASLAFNVKFVLLDHLDYISAGGKKKSVLENIDEAMREIHSLAMEFNMSVILVVHPKQVQEGKEISMSDLKGSSAIKQYADNIIIISRMDRFDPNDTLRVKVRVWKNRLIGIENSFFLRYMPECDSYTESF